MGADRKRVWLLLASAALGLLLLAACGETKVKINSPQKDDPTIPGMGTDGDGRPGRSYQLDR